MGFTNIDATATESTSDDAAAANATAGHDECIDAAATTLGTAHTSTSCSYTSASATASPAASTAGTRRSGLSC